jgi:hypothetical protein
MQIIRPFHSITMKNIMKEIRIITNKGELEGTCYMEILPGPYREKCWNEGSLFFEEEVFGYLEPIIKRHVETYDHYAFTEIKRNNGSQLLTILTNSNCS